MIVLMLCGGVLRNMLVLLSVLWMLLVREVWVLARGLTGCNVLMMHLVRHGLVWWHMLHARCFFS